MKIKSCSFVFITGILLLAGCQNPAAVNTSLNLNTTETNQTPANNSAAVGGVGGNSANGDSVNSDKNSTSNAENENLNAKPTAGKTSEKSEFTGTAGITDKKNVVKGVAVLNQVRVAGHEDYDRVVFEFEGAEMPGYHIEYVDKPIRACGSGNVVPLKGDGWLEIRFTPAAAHTEAGQPTIKSREQSPNLQIVKEMKITCDFEAEVEWVLGVASPNKYRVLELKNPVRLTIDIRH